MNQYVILPKKENGELLQKYEILIYVCIRRYMNKDTMEAFPSLDRIAKDSGCSKPTVIKTLKEIRRKGYITWKSCGRATVYTFNNEKSFEPFSYEFLDKKDLSKSEKLQILCTQQYMYKDNGIGKTSFSDRELCEMTGLNWRTLNKNTQSLIQKNYVNQVSLQIRDKESGCFKKETIYNLNDLGQAIVFAFQNHENRIQRNEDSIEELRNQVQKLEERDQKRSKDVELLLSEVRRLQKENSQLKNGEIPEVFEM